ncbi:hypothetical protein OH799_04705 [Nocardia sp. NBC_00881]|uniref:hypothetical protein n=1 Tax=Nocardia sp. NBC_00881 TaxID=2975995 RepID=UPI0038676129|nr:hypothetical protein OH799_04705 [Nocardia sp. NBC_00881]
MADSRNLALHATLPERYARVDVLASTIDHRGRLLALLVDPAQDGAAILPWCRRGPWEPPIPLFDATVVICDGDDEHQIPLHGLDQWFSKIDALGDGVILGAARIPAANTQQPHDRSAPAHETNLTRNIVAFDGDGTRAGAFYAGDGIGQLLTDPGGKIWISYFDEATYRCAMPDGTWSVSFMVGLARWNDPDGTPWFAYNDTGNVVEWCDCYALNVGQALVHACPYTKFLLVEVDASGVRSITPNPITGCSGLAVSDSALAFLDQYRRNDTPVWTIRKARGQDGVVTETGTEILALPGGRPPAGWARGKIGRDANLWLHEDGNPRQWYRYEIDC